MPIYLRYRIRDNGGVLYVHDCIKGHIVARIPSTLSTSVVADAGEIVAACASAFEAEVVSYSLNADSVEVECEIRPKSANNSQ